MSSSKTSRTPSRAPSRAKGSHGTTRGQGAGRPVSRPQKHERPQGVKRVARSSSLSQPHEPLRAHGEGRDELSPPINDYADFFEGFDDLHEGELGASLLEGELVEFEDDEDVYVPSYDDEGEDELEAVEATTEAPTEAPGTSEAPSHKPVRLGRPEGELKGSERRALRALGHHLRSIIQIGQKGVSEQLAEAVDIALTQHELIKISINSESPTEREEGAEALARSLNAHIAQIIGRTILLYRPNDKQPKLRFIYQGGKVSAEWLPKGATARIGKGLKQALAAQEATLKGTKKAQAKKAKAKAEARAKAQTLGQQRSPRGSSKSRKSR